MMTSSPVLTRHAAFKVFHDSIRLKTQQCLEFVDLTDAVIELVQRSGVLNGFTNIQTRHTTTAIIVNENEPLLLEDMRKTLDRLIPRDARYQHNDFNLRTVNLLPDENENGHSHCKGLFLRASETLNIVEGEIQLGRWQKIFLVELDGGRERSVSVMAMGEGRKSPRIIL